MTTEEPRLFPLPPPVVREVDPDSMPPQLRCVYEVVKDGSWDTLAGITERANAHGETIGAARVSEASTSARLRDLRKRGHTVERKHEPKQPNLYRFRP